MTLFNFEDREDFSDIPFNKMRVMPAVRGEVEGFIERNHYSGSIDGVTSNYCFALRHENEMMGAAIYGRMAMAGQWKKFSDFAHEVIELRRLCCVDKTPRNTESWFISRTLKWIDKNTPHRVVVSYADEEHGHSGTIYKASNFSYQGFSLGARVIDFDGKSYHDKSIRSKHNGSLKPFAISLKRALEEGRAHYRETAGKHCFVYRF